MHGVDVRALPYPKADVVQPNPELDEALALVALFGPHDADRRPPTDTVKPPILLDDRAHPQEREELLIERQAGVEPADRQHDVSDAVHFHGLTR